MLSKRSIIRVFIGSFFIQSSWSFERMQALGFAAAISPALNELYFGNERKRVEALKRHLVYYNAHPYMSSPILGAVISLEEKGAGDEFGGGGEAAARFKSMTMAPYSAIGDTFFWGSVRPLASCVGIIGSLFFGLWGPVAFLVLYNLFHIWMRWTGLNRGYTLGDKVVGYIKSLRLPERALKAKYAAMALTGLTASVYAVHLTGGGGRPGADTIAGLAVFILTSFLLNTLLRKGIGISRLVYFVVPPLLILGILGY